MRDVNLIVRPSAELTDVPVVAGGVASQWYFSKC